VFLEAERERASSKTKKKVGFAWSRWKQGGGEERKGGRRGGAGANTLALLKRAEGSHQKGLSLPVATEKEERRREKKKGILHHTFMSIAGKRGEIGNTAPFCRGNRIIGAH